MSQDTSPSTMTPDPGAIPASGPIFDVKRFVGLRWRMIAIIAVCLGVPAVVAAWFLVPVGYTATAEIRLMSTEPFVLEKGSDDTPYSTYVSTQISMITGNSVLSMVMDSPSVRNLPLLATEEDPLEFLKNCVDARVNRGSEIITVTCTMDDKESARVTLEEVLSVYMEYAVRETATVQSQRMGWLAQERDARQIELNAQLEKIAALQTSMGIPLVGETPLDTGEAELYNASLAKAEDDLVLVQNAQAEIENDIAVINGLLENLVAGQPVYDFGVEERVNTDSRVSALRGEVTMMQANLASTAEMERDSLPARKVDEKRLTSLKEHLSEVEFEVRQEVLQSILALRTQELKSAQKGVEEVQRRVDKYRELVDEYKRRIENTTDQYAQLKDIENKAAETRGILEEVLANIATIKVESNAPARVQSLGKVTVPGGGPDYMPRFMAMGIALAASIGIAGAIGFWREITDQVVRSSKDIERLTDLPVVATIPHADEDLIPDDVKLPLVTVQKPLSTLSDAFRRVLVRLLQSETESGSSKSLLVVSPMRGDGKSSLTSNLGIALAQAGRRVLLVDLSYRRPSLEALFGLQRAEGLAEVLGGHSTGQSRVHGTQVPGLYVLGPGVDTEDLVGKLASRNMVKFLEDASEQFDHVILDSPPWLIMADARLLAPLVGGVFVVIGSGVSTLGMVSRCLRELKESGAHVMGLVLNGTRFTPGGYMKKNRELYHGYGREDDSSSRVSAEASVSG